MHYIIFRGKSFNTIGFPSINADPPQQIQSQFNHPKQTPAGTQNFDACPFGNSLLQNPLVELKQKKSFIKLSWMKRYLLQGGQIRSFTYRIHVWILRGIFTYIYHMGYENDPDSEDVRTDVSSL